VLHFVCESRVSITTGDGGIEPISSPSASIDDNEMVGEVSQLIGTCSSALPARVPSFSVMPCLTRASILRGTMDRRSSPAMTIFKNSTLEQRSGPPRQKRVLCRYYGQPCHRATLHRGRIVHSLAGIAAAVALFAARNKRTGSSGGVRAQANLQGSANDLLAAARARRRSQRYKNEHHRRYTMQLSRDDLLKAYKRMRMIRELRGCRAR